MPHSILDNDLYKFTMQQAILELFPKAWAKYSFINRGEERFNQKFLEILATKISILEEEARLLPKERKELPIKCPYLKPSYLEYLSNYRFDPNEIRLHLTSENNLDLTIEGPWYRTVLWEVPLLSLISETYFETIDTNWNWDLELYTRQTKSKAILLRNANCTFSDFGTRRRRSYLSQETVVKTCSKESNFFGTSNVNLAIRFNTKVIGTMAHEWIMGNSVLEGLRNANYYALHNWVRVYNADLGIALTDTYGLDAFLGNFNLRLAKLYDGVRQDSGDPFTFIDRVTKHYKSLGIDPLTKIVLFSDNLTPQKAGEINHYCKGRIRTSFGIGTNLTNDFSYCDSKALNIVIKICEMEHIPVVKLSDEFTKACGNKDALRVARWVFNNTPLDK